MSHPEGTQRHDDKPGHPLIWSLVALLLLAFIAVAGHKYREQQRNTVIATAPLDLNCLLHNSDCASRLPEGASASLSLSPRPILSATPMQVSLKLEGLAPSGVEIHFRGESMNMGLNQFTLGKVAEGEYGAEVILPVCVRSSMMWIADVVVATPQGKVTFPFRFESRHP